MAGARGHKGGSIREKKPGVWELRVGAGKDPLTGRYLTKQVTVRGTRKQAERELARLVNVVERGETDTTKGSLADFLLERYLPHLEASDREPGTLHTYRGYIARRIIPAIGQKALGRVTTEDVDRLVLALRREGLAPSTVRQIVAILSGAYRQAERWKLVTESPIRDVTKPQLRHRRIKAPSAGEVRALIEAAEDRDVVLAGFLWTAATTGARRGELSALRRSDLDFEVGELRIDRAVKYAPGQPLGIGMPKDHQLREIALDPFTVDVLRRVLEEQEKRAADAGVPVDPDPYLFSREPGAGRPPHPDYGTKAFGRLRDELGLTVKLHDLRKFCATVTAANHDVLAAAQRLGHGSGGAITLKHYIGQVTERDRAAAHTVGSLLAGK